MQAQQKPYFEQTTSAAPLAVFRLLFGLMMLAGMVRFWVNGWIRKLYIEPDFFFSYYGFEWVKPLGEWTYLLFVVCGTSAFFVAIGFKYRLSIITFFLSFTYIELMDKTTYLNHYYFISLVSFLMIFLPAGHYFSVDAYRRPATAFGQIPRWNIDAIKLMLALVYFFAGMAKFNSDWLLQAMPLKIWLPTTDVPLLSSLFQHEAVIYLFSWSGALFDLTIPFLLLSGKTRPYAYVLVVIFHVLTRMLFPIGMFPYIMIVSTLIFFDPSLHEKLLAIVQKRLRLPAILNKQDRTLLPQYKGWNQAKIAVLGLFFVIQLALPFRHYAYPGELFWHEQGFRFSWRVMLIEKAGYAQFHIADKKTGKTFAVDNTDFLTAFQEKQMATQPDFILEYAHYLADHFSRQGHQDIQVFVDSYVALNGRRSARYVDPSVDLLQQRPSWKNKSWILPFTDEIKGL